MVKGNRKGRNSIATASIREGPITSRGFFVFPSDNVDFYDTTNQSFVLIFLHDTKKEGK